MKRFLIVSIALFLTVALIAQENQKQSRKEIRAEKKALKAKKVDSIVSNRDFTFVARSANPVGWPSIQLSPIYDLVINSDSINVYLPYYGRAYQIDYMATEGGIHFNAPLIDYNISLKKQQYHINFEAKTTNDQYQFSLSISRSGYASLTVISNNRQTISYYGILENVGL